MVFGRVLRVAGRKAVCTVDRHEFRTARANWTEAWVHPASMPERWAGQASAMAS